MAASVGTVWVDVRFNVGDVARQLQTALAAATGGVGGAGAAAANLERTWSQSLGAIATQATATGKQLTVGLTLPLSAGSSLINATSLKAQVSGSVSPAACIAVQLL